MLKIVNRKNVVLIVMHHNNLNKLHTVRLLRRLAQPLHFNIEVTLILNRLYTVCFTYQTIKRKVINIRLWLLMHHSQIGLCIACFPRRLIRIESFSDKVDAIYCNYLVEEVLDKDENWRWKLKRKRILKQKELLKMKAEKNIKQRIKDKKLKMKAK